MLAILWAGGSGVCQAVQCVAVLGGVMLRIKRSAVEWADQGVAGHLAAAATETAVVHFVISAMGCFLNLGQMSYRAHLELLSL
ncbi:uncharacterized protein N7511_005869 [Penicillium nucicola]|uniref:uncharacterized protein n=1 Tax=Penicillium nucicola TaxID=1850975 RepID=UPI0025454E29|nr:uncharacterized protein N7511_005869 [Penicillium nucicola]KAJ5762487.1 hypothetical protein N7511_005869 [Penicillium nucicola]